MFQIGYYKSHSEIINSKLEFAVLVNSLISWWTLICLLEQGLFLVGRNKAALNYKQCPAVTKIHEVLIYSFICDQLNWMWNLKYLKKKKRPQIAQ